MLKTELVLLEKHSLLFSLTGLRKRIAKVVFWQFIPTKNTYLYFCFPFMHHNPPFINTSIPCSHRHLDRAVFSEFSVVNDGFLFCCFSCLEVEEPFLYFPFLSDVWLEIGIVSHVPSGLKRYSSFPPIKENANLPVFTNCHQL